MNRVIVFTGGGTGGHVFPGLAVIEALRSRASEPAETVWIGETRGIERGLVKRFGVDFIGIPAGKLRRYLSLRNLGDIFAVLAAILRSVRELRRLKPALLFSKGGFVSVPPVIAARLLGIPSLTHESDLTPGLATQINARFVSRVLVAYPESINLLPPRVRSRAVVTGNPVRREIATGDADAGIRCASFDPADSRPVVLVVGGSQGATQLNQVVEQLRPHLAERWRIIHQTGAHGKPADEPDYFARKFFGAEYADLLAASDLLLCRSGAGTVWEAASVGKPMLLVPLGAGSRGDQLANARYFASRGAAQVFTDPKMLTAGVLEALRELAADRHKLLQMGSRGRQLVAGDAAERIVSSILDYAAGG